MQEGQTGVTDMSAWQVTLKMTPVCVRSEDGRSASMQAKSQVWIEITS